MVHRPFSRFHVKTKEPEDGRSHPIVCCADIYAIPRFIGISFQRLEVHHGGQETGVLRVLHVIRRCGGGCQDCCRPHRENQASCPKPRWDDQAGSKELLVSNHHTEHPGSTGDALQGCVGLREEGFCVRGSLSLLARWTSVILVNPLYWTFRCSRKYMCRKPG